MCKDPTNQKFQVKKEDDLKVRIWNVFSINNIHLKAFWDGMVFPSVQDFLNRADWLIESGSLEWSEAQKEKNPFKPILKVQPTNKPKVIKLYIFCHSICHIRYVTYLSIWYLTVEKLFISATKDKTAAGTRFEAERKTESRERGNFLGQTNDLILQSI